LIRNLKVATTGLGEIGWFESQVCQYFSHQLHRMKLSSTPRSAHAFSMTELAIIVVILLLLGVGLMYFLAMKNRDPHGRRIKCMNNLKQIGLAYRVFSNCQRSGKTSQGGSNENQPL
jgi:hypothetical protein